MSLYLFYYQQISKSNPFFNFINIYYSCKTGNFINQPKIPLIFHLFTSSPYHKTHKFGNNQGQFRHTISIYYSHSPHLYKIFYILKDPNFSQRDLPLSSLYTYPPKFFDIYFSDQIRASFLSQIRFTHSTWFPILLSMLQSLLLPLIPKISPRKNG